MWQSSYGGITRLRWRLSAADVAAAAAEAGGSSKLLGGKGGCGAGSGGGLGVGGGAAAGEDTATLAVTALLWQAVATARAGGRKKLGAMLAPSAEQGGRLLLLRQGRRAFSLPPDYFGNAPAGLQVAWPATALAATASGGGDGWAKVRTGVLLRVVTLFRGS